MSCDGERLKISWDHKTLPRVHLINCRGVKFFLPKNCFKLCLNSICHNLSFWVFSLSQFNFLVLSQSIFFQNLVAIWVFELCWSLSGHNLSFEFYHNICFELCRNLCFCVMCQFELSFIALWVFRFCHNLSFRVLSQFELFSLSQLDFWSFITIWVWLQFEFWSYPNLSLGFDQIWVFELSQFEIWFVTYWVFEFIQLEFLSFVNTVSTVNTVTTVTR